MRREKIQKPKRVNEPKKSKIKLKKKKKKKEENETEEPPPYYSHSRPCLEHVE
jgi:hypothetical protein